MGGNAGARGKHIVMGDADDSYDFGHIPRFVEQLRAGADVVMGNRFRGGIQKHAMPALHRYFGNPLLTRIGRLFFHSPVGDFYCGLRGFRKDAYERMGLRTTGMEFATEMVAGFLLGLWLLPGPRPVGSITFDVHTLVYAAAFVMLGFHAMAFAVFTKMFAITEGLLPPDPALDRLFRYITLEGALPLGRGLTIAG